MPEAIEQYLLAGCQAGARYSLAGARNAPQGTAGSQLARLAGESLEFMDHREYQPGDDIRRLDWAASARSDRLIVKLYRQELAPHLDIIIDASRSMALAGTAKLHAAVGVSAALATAAGNSGYSRRAFLAADDCRPVANSAAEPTHWAGLEFDSAGSPAKAVAAHPPSLRTNGTRVLVSDLLWWGEPLDVLSLLAHRAAALFVLQVLADDEITPPARGNLRLVDSETGESQEIFLDEPALKAYRDNLQRHQRNWRLACRQIGATMVPLPAERLCAAWDLSPLVGAQLLTV